MVCLHRGILLSMKREGMNPGHTDVSQKNYVEGKKLDRTFY